uniref:Uncharacterized protein n=1 Tax=mine drainage metagenome TaxID=410659 RepID=E6QB16_9ZZZZ
MSTSSADGFSFCPSPITPWTSVIPCFNWITDTWCSQTVITTSNRNHRDLRRFWYVNGVLGNLKTELSGVYHVFNFRKCARTESSGQPSQNLYNYTIIQHKGKGPIVLKSFSTVPSKACDSDRGDVGR